MLSDNAMDRAAQAFADELAGGADFAKATDLKLQVELDGQRWCYRLVCDGGHCTVERYPC